MKAWLDDFCLRSKEESALLSYLRTFFQICKEKGLYLSALKCKFFLKTLKWCGRIVTEHGYTLDPARLEGLKDMHAPETADELAQPIYCCRWMSIVIPEYARLIAPLNELLEEAYTRSGRRTKRSIRGMALSTLSWGSEHKKAFSDLQDSLRNAVMLSHPDPEKEICIYTDASDRYWSAVVTQIDRDQLTLPTGEQRHSPLAFLGSEFKGSQLGWTTF